MPKTINIVGKDYELIDTKERMTVPDCFVFGGHKIGTAHGEAKFYIGTKKDDNFNFFSHLGSNCFFLKSDILSYLNEVKSEYMSPTQFYRNKEKIPMEWQIFYEEAMKLDSEIIPFSLESQNQIEGKRFYLNSEDLIYKFIRKISLPGITYLAAQKLKEGNKIFYYFRLFMDYFDEDISQKVSKEEEEIQESKINITEKEQLIKARKGQGLYRARLLKECPYCPITMVTDERILIASHIKPWVDSNNIEKLDPKNGFLLTPTYDKLFDRGFISFNDNRTMKVSNWISPINQNKLRIKDGIKVFNLPIEGREKYLEYHRNNIFKK
jgi:predicted restriction endonuclease